MTSILSARPSAPLRSVSSFDRDRATGGSLQERLRVAIEARALMGARGTGTYVRELVRALLSEKSTDVEVWHGEKGTVNLFPNAANVVVPLRSEGQILWWLNWQLVRCIKARKPDVVHFTKADVPFRVTGVPTVVTIYDVIPLLLPETQSLLRRVYWRSALWRAVAKSDHIITISEASKRHIIEQLGADPAEITVTPLAVDTNHFSPTTRRLPGLEDPYILFVGRWDERKNIPALIQAFARIKDNVSHQLVIAGRPADKPIDLALEVKKSGAADRVQFVENVSYKDLPALYSGADVFVYPSIIEGWGFPPQEAMACGTPVIVSNGEPLPEVVGEAGIVVPYSTSDLPGRLDDNVFINQLSKELLRVLRDEKKRSHMSELGASHVAKYAWEDVAGKTMEVYRVVMRSKS